MVGWVAVCWGLLPISILQRLQNLTHLSHQSFRWQYQHNQPKHNMPKIPSSNNKPPTEQPAPFPPKGEENIPPDQAAAQARQDTKSDETKAMEGAIDARIATGGQGGGGSEVISSHPITKTVTSEEVAASRQPHAPLYPIKDISEELHEE